MYLRLANFESAIITYVSICTTGSTILNTNWLINVDDYAINGLSNFFFTEIIKTKIEKAYGTRSSQTVPHSSTILARRCLTSVIRRERVCSSWYGRRRWIANWTRSHYKTRMLNVCYSYILEPVIPVRHHYKVISLAVAYDHTTMNTPVLVWSRKLSIVGPG